jgi:hypothetical protein
MSTDTERAWAAGFFDGEGYIGVNASGAKGANKRLHIQVCQTQDGPLERLQTVIGGKIYGPYNKKGPRLPYKQLHVDGFERVQYAVCLLWPWLSSPKRSQAAAAFTAYQRYVDRPYVPRGPRPKVVPHAA